MPLNLICAASHPMIPALVPGNRLTILLDPAAPSVITQLTPRVLQRIRLAMLAGALVAAAPVVSLDQIEREVESRWLELTAYLENLEKIHRLPGLPNLRAG